MEEELKQDIIRVKKSVQDVSGRIEHINKVLIPGLNDLVDEIKSNSASVEDKIGKINGLMDYVYISYKKNEDKFK